MSVSSITTALRHEDVFLQRYDSLLKWAMQITRNDCELAEDLVHEAFVQFSLSSLNLDSIGDIDGYLYCVLRNLHYSHLRRITHQRFDQLSVVEYDSARNEFLASDPRPGIQVRDKLLAICRYACLRKETSISGSIFILRFFHGYFPEEIAMLLLCSRNVVYVQLKTVRQEIDAFLVNPCLKFSANRKLADRDWRNSQEQAETDILLLLRRDIFAARQGACFQPEHLWETCRRNQKPVNRSTVSHMVTCPDCLNESSELLGLTPLKDRHPLDALGRADKVQFICTRNEFSGIPSLSLPSSENINNNNFHVQNNDTASTHVSKFKIAGKNASPLAACLGTSSAKAVSIGERHNTRNA